MMQSSPNRFFRFTALLIVLFVLSLANQSFAQAQVETTNNDSTKVIQPVAQGNNDSTPALSPNFTNQDATSLDELVSLIPGLHIIPNAFGQKSVKINGNATGRTALYFDGILLNSAWDHDFDTRLIPTAILGGIDADRFTSQSAGGTINLSSHTLLKRQFHTEIRSQFRNTETLQGILNHFGGLGNFSYFVSAEYGKGNDLNAPSSAEMPSLFSDDQSVLHNTDHETIKLFLKSEYRFSDATKISFTALQSQEEFGDVAIFTRSDFDSTESKNRFNENVLQLASLNFQSSITRSLNLEASLWTSRSRKELENSSIQIQNARPQDVRKSRSIQTGSKIGGNIALSKMWDEFKLRLNGNFVLLSPEIFGFSSYNLSQDPNAPLWPSNISSFDEQLLLDFGANLAWKMNSRNDFQFEVEFQHASLPNSEIAGQTQNALNAKLDYTHKFETLIQYHFSAGRSTYLLPLSDLWQINDLILLSNSQFFSGTPYPALKAEVSNHIQTGLSFTSKKLAVQLDVFGRLIENAVGINEGSLNADSTGYPTFNQRNTGTLGLTVSSDWQFLDHFRIGGDLSYLVTRRLDQFEKYTIKLSNQPALLGRFSLSYIPGNGLNVMTEMILNQSNVQQYYQRDSFSDRFFSAYNEIEGKPQINARVGWKLVFASLNATVFLRANNLLDTEIYQNLRYPLPGRTLSAGVKISF